MIWWILVSSYIFLNYAWAINNQYIFHNNFKSLTWVLKRGLGQAGRGELGRLLEVKQGDVVAAMCAIYTPSPVGVMVADKVLDFNLFTVLVRLLLEEIFTKWEKEEQKLGVLGEVVD